MPRSIYAAGRLQLAMSWMRYRLYFWSDLMVILCQYIQFSTLCKVKVLIQDAPQYLCGWQVATCNVLDAIQTILLVRSDGNSLSIHSIFYTLQGEGPYSGCPAVFMRLAGCNLQCPGCDTDYTSGQI